MSVGIYFCLDAFLAGSPDVYCHQVAGSYYVVGRSGYVYRCLETKVLGTKDISAKNLSLLFFGYANDVIGAFAHQFAVVLFQAQFLGTVLGSIHEQFVFISSVCSALLLAFLFGVFLRLGVLL